MASAERIGTRKPSVPSVITSGPAVCAVVTTGKPRDIASRITSPNPSNNDGNTSTS